MKKVLFTVVCLFGFASFANDVSDFKAKLANISDYTKAANLVKGIEAYKEVFAKSSDDEKSQGYVELIKWLGGFFTTANQENFTSDKINYYLFPKFSDLSKENIISSIKDGGILNTYNLKFIDMGEGQSNLTFDLDNINTKLQDVLPESIKDYNEIMILERENNVIRDFRIYDFAQMNERLKLMKNFVGKYAKSTWSDDISAIYNKYAKLLIYGDEQSNACNPQDGDAPDTLKAWEAAVLEFATIDATYEPQAKKISTYLQANNYTCDKSKLKEFLQET
jgi:hypothetical protein